MPTSVIFDDTIIAQKIGKKVQTFCTFPFSKANFKELCPNICRIQYLFEPIEVRPALDM